MNKTENLLFKILGTSMIVGTCGIVSGCNADSDAIHNSNIVEDSIEEIEFKQEMESQLVDDNGNPYKLVKNSDGTETAIFEDGKTITFRRNVDNSELEYIPKEDDNDEAIAFGVGLLSGIATSYFLLNGFNTQQGHIVDNRYVFDNKPSYIRDINHRKELLSNYRQNKEDKRSTGIVSNTVRPSSTEHKGSTVNSSANGNKPSSTPSVITKPSPNAKSGFGSVGARSAVS